METLFSQKKDFNLTEEKLAIFKDKVQNLDLEPIMWKITNPEEGEGWRNSKVEKICNQYRMFLYLIYAYPDKNIVPTRDIDKFWHTHILDTQLYIQHCSEIFGYYLHHFPYFGARGEQDKINLDTSFESTVELFKKYSVQFELSDSLQSSTCGDGTDSSTYCVNNACDSATCTPSRTTDLYSQRPKRQQAFESLQSSTCGDGDDSSTYCVNNACDSATCTPSRTADLYSQRPKRQQALA